MEVCPLEKCQSETIPQGKCHMAKSGHVYAGFVLFKCLANSGVEVFVDLK